MNLLGTYFIGVVITFSIFFAGVIIYIGIKERKK